MRPSLTSIISIAAILGLALWLAVEQQRQVGLRREHQALEQQLGQMAQLTGSNEQLSNLLAQAESPQSLNADESRELLRLRGQVAVLHRQAGELEAARQENRHARAELASAIRSENTVQGPATADYWPHDSWAFKGYASADAALQSFLWAADNGDMKALLASVTGEVRKMMEDDLKEKSEAEVAIRMMDEVASLKSVRVVNREAQGDDTVVITAQAAGRKDDDIEKLMMKKIGNEWRFSGMDR